MLAEKQIAGVTWRDPLAGQIGQLIQSLPNPIVQRSSGSAWGLPSLALAPHQPTNDINSISSLTAREEKTTHPVFAFWTQEITQYNTLRAHVESELRGLQRALSGRLPFTPARESLLRSILSGTVPLSWTFIYPSHLPLASWIHDLGVRMNHLASWIDGVPPRQQYWLGALIHPQGLLSAAHQAFLRRTSSVPSGQILWEFSILPQEPGLIAAAAKDGLVVRDLVISGARWDTDVGILVDALPMEYYSRLPLIHFKPVTHKPSRLKVAYPAPLFIRPRPTLAPSSGSAFLSANIGYDPGYVLDVDLKIQGPKDAAYWARKGVALTLSPPHY